jgi:PAS domain S-box-containing protein
LNASIPNSFHQPIAFHGRDPDSAFSRVALDLQHLAFPEFAMALRDRIDVTLKQWRARCIRAMPHLDRLTVAEFENGVANILVGFSEAMQSDQPEQIRKLSNDAHGHGVERSALGVGLEDFLEEGRILRGVVVHELSDAMSRALSADEATTFHAMFDFMIQQGVMALMRKQREGLEKTEETLKDSQRFLRSSLDSLEASIAVLDAEGTILDVNKSWRRFAGENSFVGDACGLGTSYLDPCEQSAGADVSGAVIAEGIRDVMGGRRNQFEAEYPCHSPTEERWFLVRVTKFEGPGPLRIIVTHDNITHRRLAEDSCRELAARLDEHLRVFDRVLSSISDFAYTFDLEGRFTFANKALLSLWGLMLPQVIGKKFADLGVPEDLAKRLATEIQQVVETGHRVVGETPYTSPTGVSGYYEYIFSAISASDGTVEAVAGSTRDVTEQKRVQEALRVSLAEQERLLVSERIARDAAESANRAKDKFLAVLSHELRTPLAPVVMTVTALEMNEDLPAAVRDDLKVIRRNVELEAKLIDDLLDVSRIISGKMRLRFDPVDVNDLVRHVCTMCRSNVLEKGIRLHCDLDAKARPVMGDPARLQQVFWNLLTNAAKFTPNLGDVFVKTEALSDQVRMTVRDTGMGIPQEMLPRIFDAFEQGDPRMTRQFGGMGLGLTICKAMVEQHSGSIRVESMGQNSGSTFVVDLPAITPALALKTSPPPVRSGQSGVAPLRLLVVEDHADSARILRRLLMASGHAVRTAGTVATAMDLAREHIFDIVISDLGLPDATGFELMQHLKKSHGMLGIAMSGFGMEEDLIKSNQAGFSEHLVKPVNFADLERAIQRVYNNFVSTGKPNQTG